MAIVSDVEIRLRADIARLQQDLNAARRSVSGAVGDMKKTLLSMAAGFSLATVVQQVITAQRQFDKLNSSLTTATGSTKAAGEAFAVLQDFAAKTPFGLQEVTTAFLKLRNLGLTPSERALTSYGNTAAGMGKDLNQLIEAVADAATGEFERLKEFGIKSKQQGDQVAFTFQGTTTKVGNNAKEIEEYLMAIGEVNFAGGMERQAATLDGALSALGDQWDQTLVAFSQSGFGDAVHASVLSLSGALGDLIAMFKAVTGAADEEGKKVEEIGPLHKGLTTFFEAIMVLGVNVAYVFKTIGKDLGAFAAQAAALFRGGMSGLIDGSTLKAVQTIGKARVAEAQRERAEVDATSAKILGAAAAAQASRAKEAAERAKDTTDRLAKYKIVSNAAQGATDAQKKAAAEQAKATEKLAKAYSDFSGKVDARVAETAREAAGLVPLNDAQKMELELKEKLAEGTLRLTAAQEASVRGRIAEVEANLAAVESQKAYKKMQEDGDELAKQMASTRAGSLDAAREELKNNEDLVRTFGMTESAIARVEVARLKEQLAQRSSVGMTLDEIEHLESLISLKERSAEAVTARESLEAVQEFWTSIDKTAHDTFVSILDGGKGLGQRLKDTLKNTFFDWLYQMTVKKWIINIGTSISGAGGVSGISQAAGMLGGGSGGSVLGSLASTASNLYGAYTGGMTLAGGLGTGFMGSLAGGLNGAGIGSGLTSALGMNIGNSIAGVVGPQVASGIATGLSGLAAAVPWVAGALAVYAIGKKAFGRGPKEFTGNSTINGALGAGGFSGTQDADWLKKGGWFRSDKRGVDKMAVDAAMSTGLAAAYDSIKATSADFARVLGVNADHIANRTQVVRIALGKDEAENEKAIAEFFAGVADTVAREVLPDLGKFQQAGETAAATLQRVTGNFQAVDRVLAVLGTTSAQAFRTIGVASVEARERLVAMAGGVDALAQQAQFFVDNFMTTAQKVAPLQNEVARVMQSLGLASVTTAEQFSAAVSGLVQSGALATEEGARTYSTLMQLGPAFKAVADHLEEVRVAAVDAGRAQADAYLATLERQVAAQRDIVTAAYESTMAQLEQRVEGINATIARTGELSAALRGALGTVDGDTQQAAMRAAAQAQITAALAIAKASGSLPRAEDIRDALAALGRDASGQFDSLAAYQREVARTNNELIQLGDMSDAQLGTAERQLRALQDAQAAAKVANDLEMMRLDGILSHAQAQVAGLSAANITLAQIADTLVRMQAGGSGALAAPAPNLMWELQRQQIMDSGLPVPNYTAPSVTMNSDAAMLAALQSMEARMAQVEQNTMRAAAATSQLAQQFDTVSAGGNALATEVV